MSEWRLAEGLALDTCLGDGKGNGNGNDLDDWLRRLSARRTHKVQYG